mmetsp:Transcript_26249/g.67872  ORF Transcript_26249/g.67872 Transcript_26249/m.67872 type:complete len:345 (-) Transcript_26249:224-1258(-)
MKRLDALALVHRDVEQVADDLAEGWDVNVQVAARQAHLVEHVLHLGRPLLHKRLDLGHVLRVGHSGRRLVGVQLGHLLDPVVDACGVLGRVLNGPDLHKLGAARLGDVANLLVEHCRVALHRRWLVQHAQAQEVGLAVGPWHLDELIDVADRRDVIRDEALELDIKLVRPRLEAPNVLKQLAHLTAHVEVLKLARVVATRGIIATPTGSGGRAVREAHCVGQHAAAAMAGYGGAAAVVPANAVLVVRHAARWRVHAGATHAGAGAHRSNAAIITVVVAAGGRVDHALPAVAAVIVANGHLLVMRLVVHRPRGNAGIGAVHVGKVVVLPPLPPTVGVISPVVIAA